MFRDPSQGVAHVRKKIASNTMVLCRLGASCMTLYYKLCWLTLAGSHLANFATLYFFSLRERNLRLFMRELDLFSWPKNVGCGYFVTAWYRRTWEQLYSMERLLLQQCDVELWGFSMPRFRGGGVEVWRREAREVWGLLELWREVVAVTQHIYIGASS